MVFMAGEVDKSPLTSISSTTTQLGFSFKKSLSPSWDAPDWN